MAVVWALAAFAQDFSEIQFEKNAANLRFTDGPAWSKTLNGLIFTDVASGSVQIFVPGKGVSLYREGLAGPSGLAIDSENRLLIAESRGRRLIRVPVGQDKDVEVLAERFEGKRLNAPNDLVVRKDGHIYFTDPAFGMQTEAKELDFHGIFHLTPKGELEVIAKPKGRPNGITLAPNGRILYVTNSDERKVYAYDLDGRGKASGERVLVNKTEGVPAGIETDEKGNLYVAEGSLQVYSPSGQPIHRLVLAEKPSNVAFGDPDGLTLYVTAKTSLYRTRVKTGGAGFRSEQ